MDKSFWRAGHLPTLLSAFLYFDLAFMVWVLLGPLAIHIARDLGLSPAEKGLMVATPLLAGALLRLVMGVLVDHLKPKLAGAIGQLLVMAALAVAWLLGVHSFSQVMLLAVFLGVAGASFAAALPLASRWYPPHYQGAAMGIAGAGNSGTAIAALFAPGLAKLYGWNAVFGLALLPLMVVFLIYMAYAKDSPACPPPKRLSEYLKVLKERDAWWFMFLYGVTFGGFSGLASSLTVYFNDQYGLDPVQAGIYTAVCVFAGSLMRPIGGMVADRVGGIRSLSVIYLLASICLLLLSLEPPRAWMALVALVTGMLWLGMGNGAVFQLVPQRFSAELGVMTGLVGMAGGIGGFCLAAGLGYSKQLSGGYGPGLSLFAALSLCAWLGLLAVKHRWRNTWGALHIAGAKV
ncbi:NarK/NasA family nitrate transporter [Chitinimonas arctica]|uniref:NarK/NasA family nitrate transporter n=1 Tax=Chitinimonas arctica TaxID=2594795 RepID=A0A516SLC2_9NEIS|nr:nitrate/nitrite transporter [Chitinimonas arctica]QDQ28954.1 NarK/NasA family nitrate transporter [Chitinimonas arctica]